MPEPNDSRDDGAGRVFRFLCGRCGSPLEAEVSRVGETARCPTCTAEFEIPRADVRQVRLIARTAQEAGEDHPAAAHAYAADGERAPRIVTGESGQPVIQCPRCGRTAAIDAHRCPACAQPFTAAGFSTRPGLGLDVRAVCCLLLGIGAPAFIPCAGAGAVLPAMAAVLIGVFAWMALPAGERLLRFLILVGLSGALTAVVLVAVAAR